MIGQAAQVLEILLDGSHSIGQLYVLLKSKSPRANFDSFAGTLAFLYAAGVIHHNDGIVGLTQC